MRHSVAVYESTALKHNTNMIKLMNETKKKQILFILNHRRSCHSFVWRCQIHFLHLFRKYLSAVCSQLKKKKKCDKILLMKMRKRATAWNEVMHDQTNGFRFFVCAMLCLSVLFSKQTSDNICHTANEAHFNVSRHDRIFFYRSSFFSK